MSKTAKMYISSNKKASVIINVSLKVQFFYLFAYSTLIQYNTKKIFNVTKIVTSINISADNKSSIIHNCCFVKVTLSK